MLSNFLEYLSDNYPGEEDQMPSLSELSKALGISLSTLREQLEVARVLGFIEIKPRAGMRTLPYNFSNTVKLSTCYGIKRTPSLFKQYTSLRNHLELSYWYEAARLIDNTDISEMYALVSTAKKKLLCIPIELPACEHRRLHMLVYSKLQNPFVIGLLETYWDLFEQFGYLQTPEIDYLEKVWLYHGKIVDAVANNDLALGYNLMREHMDLFNQRTTNSNAQSFE